MLLTLWLAAIGVVPHDLALAFGVDSVLTYLALKTCWGCVRCRGRQSDSPPLWGGWPSREAHGEAKEGTEGMLPGPCPAHGKNIRGPREESPSPRVQRRKTMLDSVEVRPTDPGKKAHRAGRFSLPTTVEEDNVGEKERKPKAKEKNSRTEAGACTRKAHAAGTVVLEGIVAHNPPLGMEEWSGTASELK